MEHLLFTLNAILPILIPIFLGYFLKKMNFFSDGFLNEANKLVFKILIPVLLFSNIYLADIRTINWAFIGFSSAGILILFVVGLLIVTFMIPDPKQKGVVLQASFRSNYAIIGIPLATLLGGASAKVEASVVAAISVPLFNILAVISLSIFDKEPGEKVSIKNVLYKIITNPLMIGVFAGLLFCLSSLLFQKIFNFTLEDEINLFNDSKGLQFFSTSIDYIGRCATPIALLVLGGKFKFTAVKSFAKQLIVSVSLRLVITPLIFLVIAYYLGFKSSTNFAILIALFATPIAVSSAPMAAQMGQDEELAGQIVVWTSALSAISLFLIIIICSSIGIF